MKKSLLLIGLLLFTIQIFSQAVPSKIKKAFKNQFPEATDANWRYDGDYKLREWKVLYKSEDVLHSSWYDYKGNWIQTKTKIDKSKLPEAVLKSIEEDYASYKIVIVARFENPDIDGYEVFLNNENIGGFDVQYTKAGKLYHRTMRSKGYKPLDDDGNVIEE
jgi:hypothetical protein